MRSTVLTALSCAAFTAAQFNTDAKAAGKLYFGSATDNPELVDTTYTSILKDTTLFGQITPGNSMKWDATEPAPNNFTFAGGDQILNLAKANGQILRAHNLVWTQQLPAWVTNGNFDAPTLTSVIQNHIANVAGHYAGQVYCWDVVNEPLNSNGTFLDNVFFKTLGESYISIALNAARKADPKAKLYINDFGIEFGGPKTDAMINLVKNLKAAGVPIDGVGFESHLIVGEVPDMTPQLKAFTALGVEVAITELDIRMAVPASSANLTQQAKDYQSVISACLAVEGCVGMTVWDFTDKFSWVPSTFPGQGSATPFDENFQKKPAFDGILAGLGAPVPATATAAPANAGATSPAQAKASSAEGIQLNKLFFAPALLVVLLQVASLVL